MSSPYPGFRRVPSALRNLHRSRSPPKTVTWCNSPLVHHIDDEARVSREAQLKSSLSSSSKQQPESITRGERGGVAVAKRPIRKMPEARVRNARKHGELNFGSELTAMLYAFGDSKRPLPETIRILDEVVTDFIIETCHQAARTAHISGRQKVKVDDFKFAIRGDEVMLGRVKELLTMDKELKEARKQFNPDEAEMGEGKGRKRKRVAVEEGEDR